MAKPTGTEEKTGPLGITSNLPSPPPHPEAPVSSLSAPTAGTPPALGTPGGNYTLEPLGTASRGVREAAEVEAPGRISAPPFAQPCDLEEVNELLHASMSL